MVRRGNLIISSGFSVVVVLFAIYFLVANKRSLDRLLDYGPQWLVWLSEMLVVNLIARSWYMSVLVHASGRHAPLSDCICIVAASNFLSMLLPQASGSFYRAYQLKAFYRVDLLQFVNGTVLFGYVWLLVWCAIALLGLTAAGLPTGLVGYSILVVVLALIGSIFAPRLAKWLSCRRVRGRVPTILLQIEEASAMFKHRQLYVASVAVLAAIVSSQVIGLHFILAHFGISLALMSSATISAFQQVSGTISLTPGGIGAQEFAGAMVAANYDVDNVDVLIVFAMMRAARLLLSACTGISGWLTLKYVRKRVPPFTP